MSSSDAVHPERLISPASPWLTQGCQRARKPDGGFLKRPLATFLLPWWGHQHARLTLEDLHVWLGVQELIERRCQKEPETPAHYTLTELQRLLQAPRRAPLAHAVDRLEEVGVLTWTPTRLSVLPHPERLEACDPTRLAALRAALPPGLTWVPVPRRLNVWLAREGQPGLIATALGVLVRCMRYTERQCVAGGRVAASWIARVFGVAERTVHRSLQTLEAYGWLARRPEGPAQERQHGRFTMLNLHWERPGMVVRPPREGDTATGAEASPAPRREEPPGCRSAARRQESCRNLSPLPEVSCQNLSPLPEEYRPLTHQKYTRYDGHQPTQVLSQPFQEIKIQKSEPTEHRPTGGWQGEKKAEGQEGAQPLAVTRPAPLDETTVTKAEWMAATASLMAQGFKAAFLIRPTVLAEVQRLRQAAFASPVPTLVPRPPTPPQQATTLPTPEAAVCAPVTLAPRGPAQSAVTPAPFIDGRPKPANESVPQAPALRPARQSPCQRPPALAEVVPADLREVGRLLDLYQQATARGWLRGSEAERLHVVAAAVHALRVGDDPCKLFVWLLQHQAWELITQEEEDQARQRLRAYDWGPCRRSTTGGTEPAMPALSDEARFVQQAEQVVRQAGWRGEPFLAVKLHDATWTRERWDAAQAELAQWRQGQVQQQRGLRAREELSDAEAPA